MINSQKNVGRKDIRDSLNDSIDRAQTRRDNIHQKRNFIEALESIGSFHRSAVKKYQECCLINRVPDECGFIVLFACFMIEHQGVKEFWIRRWWIKSRLSPDFVRNCYHLHFCYNSCGRIRMKFLVKLRFYLPKLVPPPFNAQNKSALSSALALTIVPSARTTYILLGQYLDACISF